MQVSEKSITQMGYKRQESRPFLVFIARPLILRNFRAQIRAVPLLKLRLPGFTQSRTENRCALFLELLSLVSQFRTENRCALFLELLSWFHAIPDGKPLRTFPGIALGNLAQALATVREDRRLAMMLPSGKQLGRIPGGERPLCRVSGGGVLTISVPVKGA
ncbi:hypothetical protein [Rhizobium leguminosarum]|jgi:hypothetical protein|uniref:hypothetical protein n=1 Tax=Rhizobium leguminosarum TaxID=384 RepID=UPI0015F84F39|nr:hypothetical protein [Rhizobium leguminosarum]MBA9031694.1 hypothetical protein [Rhizobium leguminosarum]